MAMKTTTMKSKLPLFAGALLVLAMLGFAHEVPAHSFPEEQHPSAGQTLGAPPSEIQIKFDAPIEKLFAKLQVLGADGKDHAVGGPLISDDGIMLTSKIDSLKPGIYTV